MHNKSDKPKPESIEESVIKGGCQDIPFQSSPDMRHQSKLVDHVKARYSSRMESANPQLTPKQISYPSIFRYFTSSPTTTLEQGLPYNQQGLAALLISW
jgi:hypothetical protein